MDSSWDGSTAPPPDAPGTCAVQRSDLTLTADILQRIQQEDPALQEAAIQDGYINEGIMAGMDEEAAQEEKKAVDRSAHSSKLSCIGPIAGHIAGHGQPLTGLQTSNVQDCPGIPRLSAVS